MSSFAELYRRKGERKASRLPCTTRTPITNCRDSLFAGVDMPRALHLARSHPPQLQLHPLTWVATSTDRSGDYLERWLTWNCAGQPAAACKSEARRLSGISTVYSKWQVRGLPVVLPVWDSTLIGLNPTYDSWHIALCVRGTTGSRSRSAGRNTTAWDCLTGARLAAVLCSSETLVWSVRLDDWHRVRR